MTRDQLLKAKAGIVALIREQGEKRLENQCAFMDAQDNKGGALLTGATALAAAAVAVASGAAALVDSASPLIVGGAVAAVGFSLSSALSVISLRSTGFHAVGWYPNDFAADLENGHSSEEVEADFVLALQERLSENRKVLDRRGDLQDWASYLLLATPLAALISVYLAA